MSSSASGPGDRTLERGAIGLTEVLFQSITHMAPAVATALSIGLATLFAGGITPLAVVFALIACLFTAYSMSQLARHMSSAGGMYTYVTRGLGTFVGWLMAWAFTLAEPIVPAALFAAFGFFGASFITELTGFSNDLLWLPLAIICGVVVWFLTYRGIQISTRTGVILGLIEIGIFLVLAVLLIANAETPVQASVFIPADGNVTPAFQGIGLLHPGFRRVRSGGAARRGDPRAAEDDPAGDPPVVPAHRPVLRLLLLRCDGLLRSGPDAGRLPRVQRGQPLGRHGRRDPADARRTARHVRDHQQLPRELERRRDRVDAVDLLARPGPACCRTRSARSTRPTRRRSTRRTSRASSASDWPWSSASASPATRTAGRSRRTASSATSLGLLFAGDVRRRQRRLHRLLPRRAPRRVQPAEAPRRARSSASSRWSSGSSRRSAA